MQAVKSRDVYNTDESRAKPEVLQMGSGLNNPEPGSRKAARIGAEPSPPLAP
jgi:hypothetical protein